MGIVCLIDSDADAVRNSGYLACGIDDASIVLLSPVWLSRRTNHRLI